MRLIVMRKAGENARVAINPDRVTYVRSVPGNFVDLHFGDHKIAVEGSFEEVVNRLSDSEVAPPTRDPAKVWMSMTRD